jgi:raffinose/stachyose/melibiose transport system permease protein
VPAFTTNITLLLAWGLRSFDLPMVVSANMVEGQTTAVYIYQSIFANSKAGLGQAAAIILTVILIVLTQVVTRVLRRLEVEL